VRHRIKWPVAASVMVLLLTLVPLRANALSTRTTASLPTGVTKVLSQGLAVSTSFTHSIAVCLNGELLSLWSDGDEEDKKNNDKDDRVPEPGVILQLALGLLGVVGLRLFLKPQESNPR